MIKAIIFDMDGVILDSEPFWRKAEIKIFNHYNIPINETMCRSVMGKRIDEVVNLWLLRFNKQELDSKKIQNEIVNEVNNLVLSEGKLLPGVKELMKWAKENKLKLAIASSSFKILIETVIKKFKLENDLDIWKSSENEEFGKPHPAVYIATAKALNLATHECLVIEDSLNGLIAAKAAGMKTIAVPDAENYNNAKFVLSDVKLSSLALFTPQILKEIK